MKVCPVCGAECFDDMETCFECLHSFKEDVHAEKTPIEQMQQAAIDSHMLKPQSDTLEVTRTELMQRESHPSHANYSNANYPKCEFIDSTEVLSSPVNSSGDSMVASGNIASNSAICDYDDEDNTQTWVLKLGVPAGCEGVTVRLARA